MDKSIYFPVLGIKKATRGTGETLYLAKVNAANKLGLFKPGIPRSFITNTARVKRKR